MFLDTALIIYLLQLYLLKSTSLQCHYVYVNKKTPSTPIESAKLFFEY